MYVIYLIFLGLSLLTVSLIIASALKVFESLGDTHALGHLEDPLEALELEVSEF